MALSGLDFVHLMPRIFVSFLCRPLRIARVGEFRVVRDDVALDHRQELIVEFPTVAAPSLKDAAGHRLRLLASTADLLGGDSEKLLREGTHAPDLACFQDAQSDRRVAVGHTFCFARVVYALLGLLLLLLRGLQLLPLRRRVEHVEGLVRLPEHLQCLRAPRGPDAWLLLDPLLDLRLRRHCRSPLSARYDFAARASARRAFWKRSSCATPRATGLPSFQTDGFERL